MTIGRSASKEYLDALVETKTTTTQTSRPVTRITMSWCKYGMDGRR